jgi:hypothetical protein
MEILNRVALIVRPKRRYVEWANQVESSGPRLTLEEVRLQPTTYLVTPEEDEDGGFDLQAMIDFWYHEIFEDQLAQWNTEESTWPVNRTPHVFRDWFDVESSELVADLDEDLPLVDEPQPLGVDDAMARCGWCLKEFSEEDHPLAVTVALPTDEPLEIPRDVALPWPIGTAHGFALATAPETEMPAGPGWSPATFYVCSETCAQALREDLTRQDETPSE